MKNPYSRTKLTSLFAASLAFVWFTLLPTVQAVSPPPDGGYPNGNTAEGTDALFSLTTGYNNTGIGFDALFSNTEGVFNTAVGHEALLHNTTGIANTAFGDSALTMNTIGYNNTAAGFGAMFVNTTGNVNTAYGSFALNNNTTGSENTVVGFDALLFNTTGSDNTATGVFALEFNATGSNNTSSGFRSLGNNSTGNSNIALGFEAGLNLTTGDNNIDIGNAGVADESGIIRIGTAGTHRAAVIAGVSNSTIARGMPVIVNREGRLGVMTSSERFKDAIKPMDKASEAILSLQPVTFRYKKELDPQAIPQFGLVAEQVEKVNPDLVARDELGKAYTVRYEAVNAMLLNEFLKEHRKVEEQAQINREQEAKIAGQQKEIAALTAGLKEQAAQIQKVSDQLRTQALAPRVVAND